MEGAWPPGSTVMVNSQTPRFWQRSNAWHVTTFTPQGKKLPEGGLQTTALTTPLLSVAVGVG